MAVKIKRAYEDAHENDGVRVLVDGIWPRGVSKKELKIDHWMKEVAPTDKLRKWFNHEREKFNQFKKDYKEELTKGEQAKKLKVLKKLTIKEKKHVTLIYGAKDEEHNQAVVLKEILDRQEV